MTSTTTAKPTKRQLKSAQFRSKGKGREGQEAEVDGLLGQEAGQDGEEGGEEERDAGAAAKKAKGVTKKGAEASTGKVDGDEEALEAAARKERKRERREEKKRKEADQKDGKEGKGEEKSGKEKKGVKEVKGEETGSKEKKSGEKKASLAIKGDTVEEGKEGGEGKKRKRQEGKEPTTTKSKKKRFTEDGQVEEVEVLEEKVKDEEEGKEDRRYIVFVGNMSFQSTSDQIARHFASHCNETPTVRLLTKKGEPNKLAQLSKSKQKSIAKGKAADPSAATSKGCAFVEFKAANSLQKALQFHHTQFQGRNINVELTAGGGGKGNERKEKIRKKNQDLEVERQKIHEKYVKAGKKEKTEEKEQGGEKVEEKAALPQWGPRAAATKGLAKTKVPKWAASGANAVRLSG